MAIKASKLTIEDLKQIDALEGALKSPCEKKEDFWDVINKIREYEYKYPSTARTFAARLIQGNSRFVSDEDLDELIKIVKIPAFEKDGGDYLWIVFLGLLYDKAKSGRSDRATYWLRELSYILESDLAKVAMIFLENVQQSSEVRFKKLYERTFILGAGATCVAAIINLYTLNESLRSNPIPIMCLLIFVSIYCALFLVGVTRKKLKPNISFLKQKVYIDDANNTMIVKERIMHDLGERDGCIESAKQGFYCVAIDTFRGIEHYMLPESTSVDKLAEGDAVTCYLVDGINGIEPRLRRIVEPTGPELDDKFSAMIHSYYDAIKKDTDGREA